MTIHPSTEGAGSRDDPATEAPNPVQGDTQQHQMGYGHRAHSPDPAAQYGFKPGEPRLLPVEKKRRWRVTG